MAVPKKRVGKSAQGHRRSNWKATVPATTTCKNCGELALTHTVCTACGYYKGKVVSIKAEGYVEETTEKPKKTTKKAAAPKKTTKKAEEKAVEKKTETKAEVEVEAAEEITETPEAVETEVKEETSEEE